MKRPLLFVIGILVGIALCIIVPLLVLASGAIDMGATVKASSLEKTIAPWAVDKSRERRAPLGADPYTNSPAVLAVGMDHYRENCVMCHGAPDVPAGELAKGLNPPAPQLQSKGTQSMTDGELFWTVKNGVRMTGMPAFGPTHTDDQIWKIVAFVRHLPHLTASEKARLQKGTGEEPSTEKGKTTH